MTLFGVLRAETVAFQRSLMRVYGTLGAAHI